MAEQKIYDKEFSDVWDYPTNVRKSIQECGMYDTRVGDGVYQSGRQKYITYFLTTDGKSLLTTRDAMMCTSAQSGQTYYMCKKLENTTKKSAKSAVDAILAKQV